METNHCRFILFVNNENKVFILSEGSMEFRQKEIRHLNFDNIVKFLQLSKFLWNYDRIFFAGNFIVHFPSEFGQRV